MSTVIRTGQRFMNNLFESLWKSHSNSPNRLNRHRRLKGSILLVLLTSCAVLHIAAVDDRCNYGVEKSMLDWNKSRNCLQTSYHIRLVTTSASHRIEMSNKADRAVYANRCDFAVDGTLSIC